MQWMTKNVYLATAIVITDKDENDQTPYNDIRLLEDDRIKEWVTKDMHLLDPYAIWGMEEERMNWYLLLQRYSQ